MHDIFFCCSLLPVDWLLFSLSLRVYMSVCHSIGACMSDGVCVSVTIFFYIFSVSSISCQDTDNVIPLKTMSNGREKKTEKAHNNSNNNKLYEITKFFSLCIVIANNSNCQRCFSSFARFLNDIVNGTDMSERERERQRLKQEQNRSEKKIYLVVKRIGFRETRWKNIWTTDIIEYARKSFLNVIKTIVSKHQQKNTWGEREREIEGKNWLKCTITAI